MMLRNLWLADVDGNLVQGTHIAALTIHTTTGTAAAPEEVGEVTLRVELAIPGPDGTLVTRALTPWVPYAVADQLRKHLVLQLAKAGSEVDLPLVLRVELKDNVIRWTVDRLGAATPAQPATEAAAETEAPAAEPQQD